MFQRPEGERQEVHDMRERLENHHIAGRQNSELTATLCLDCHLDVTNRQMVWDSRWTHIDNPEKLRYSFLLQGIQELLIEMHFKTGIKDYRLLADSLSSHIQHYREIA